MTKLWVDPSRCQGHARCYALAPETFSIDEEGYAFVIEGREQSYNEDNVRKAIKNCPERAIKLDETE
ncbi:ferredoxin [Citricoccus nitrophenolicus]|uniref:ferredoxin n=1 Tax=Citricoccus nitrophenolicus TaxID=863575 RepID=UPI0031EAC44A